MRDQTAHRAVPNIDRQPPHSIEAEQGVLGCALLSSECIDEIQDALKKDGDRVFYDNRHSVLWLAMQDVHRESRGKMDLLLLNDYLRDCNELESVGGLSYLSTLPDMVPSAANLDYYLDIVLEKFLMRRAIQICTGAIGDIMEHTGSVNELLDSVERDIISIRSEFVLKKQRTMKELVDGFITRVEYAHTHQGESIGISTGFADIDHYILGHGFKPGELFVIGARPSVGKTSLAMNIVDHVGVKCRIPTGVFSLEMTADSLTDKIVCSSAEVNIRDIMDGRMVERDFSKLTNAAGRIAPAPIYIDDTPGMSIITLRSKARRMVELHGVKIIWIDYMQLLAPEKRSSNRERDVAGLSTGLKALALELNIPVVVLASLNRETEKRPTGEPKLSDFRESGQIESDADTAAIMWRKKKDPNTEDDAAVDIINFDILKQRNGPTGRAVLTFFREITKFQNTSKIDPNDAP